MKAIFEHCLVRNIPLAKGLMVPETTPTRDVLLGMRTNKTGCVVVTRRQKVTGIFTERDFLNRIAGKDVSWDEPIATYATKNPQGVPHRMPLREAMTIMKDKGVRYVLVFRNDTFKGVLSIRHIIQLFAEHFPADLMNMPPLITKHPMTPEGG